MKRKKRSNTIVSNLCFSYGAGRGSLAYAKAASLDFRRTLPLSYLLAPCTNPREFGLSHTSSCANKKKHPLGCFASQEEGVWHTPRRRRSTSAVLSPSLIFSLLARTPENSGFLTPLPAPTKKHPLGCFLWRRKRDSNPRGLSPKRFSRPPRYDRFDIPACFFRLSLYRNRKVLSTPFRRLLIILSRFLFRTSA